MKQSQVCCQYCIQNHMIAAKLHVEGTPVHTPVSLQSGQLLSEVLYLHLPLLPGNMRLKLLSKINNNSAHHDTMMYTPYQNYNRCQSKYPTLILTLTLTLTLIFIGHLFSLTREQCLKILICASFSSELQITRKVTHIHSSRMKSKTYRLYTNLLFQKFHLCLQVLHMWLQLLCKCVQQWRLQ